MVRGRKPLRIDRGAAPVAMVVALAALAMVLLTVAASSGVVRVWTEPPIAEPRRLETGVVTPDEPPPSEFSLPALDEDLTPPDTWWWRVVAVLILLALLRVAWIVISVYWQLLRFRLSRRPKPAGALSPLPGSNGTEEAEVSFDLDAGLMHLQRGDPRNAIVACWLQLEDDVAAAGLPRAPSETSVEYTQRVLASASVDASATLELAELYREARFSDHPVDDAHRDRAIEALRRVHASLRVHSALRVRETDAAGSGVPGGVS